MNAPTNEPILLLAPDGSDAADVEHALADAGHTIERHNCAPTVTRAGKLIIADARREADIVYPLLRRLRQSSAERLIPTLTITAETTTNARAKGFAAGADAVLVHPFSRDDLLGQVSALLRIKKAHDQLAGKAVELQSANVRLHSSHQRVNQELELARRIQLSFLPQNMPDVPRVRFAVHYRPCGRVGGDFYDVFRLDEQYIGFYVADAMGHGVPASLLTMFLKRGVQAKDIFQSQYRIVPPDEVLQRLNHDLLEQGIMEDAFITMVYGLYDIRDGTLQFARAGHPHPVRVSSAAHAQIMESPGTLLGVFETKFFGKTVRLDPGDKALFYTDGTESVTFENQPAGRESFLACVNRHSSEPIHVLVDRLAYDLCHRAAQPDDFTVLGLEVTA
jgi:sigma-B regulation protein RsbU (phosphoserine phosphatase)